MYLWISREIFNHRNLPKKISDYPFLIQKFPQKSNFLQKIKPLNICTWIIIIIHINNDLIYIIFCNHMKFLKFFIQDVKLTFIYKYFKCPLWMIKIKLRANNSITNIPKNTNIQKIDKKCNIQSFLLKN